MRICRAFEKAAHPGQMIVRTEDNDEHAITGGLTETARWEQKNE
jgi:hypothetical protein